MTSNGHQSESEAEPSRRNPKRGRAGSSSPPPDPDPSDRSGDASEPSDPNCTNEFGGLSGGFSVASGSSSSVSSGSAASNGNSSTGKRRVRPEKMMWLRLKVPNHEPFDFQANVHGFAASIFEGRTNFNQQLNITKPEEPIHITLDVGDYDPAAGADLFKKRALSAADQEITWQPWQWFLNANGSSNLIFGLHLFDYLNLKDIAVEAAFALQYYRIICPDNIVHIAKTNYGLELVRDNPSPGNFRHHLSNELLSKMIEDAAMCKQDPVHLKSLISKAFAAAMTPEAKKEVIWGITSALNTLCDWELIIPDEDNSQFLIGALAEDVQPELVTFLSQHIYDLVCSDPYMADTVLDTVAWQLRRRGTVLQTEDGLYYTFNLKPGVVDELLKASAHGLLVHSGLHPEKWDNSTRELHESLRGFCWPQFETADNYITLPIPIEPQFLVVASHSAQLSCLNRLPDLDNFRNFVRYVHPKVRHAFLGRACNLSLNDHAFLDSDECTFPGLTTPTVHWDLY